MEHRFFEPNEVDEITNDTRSVSKDPYKLFIALVLTSIYDEFVYEDGEDVDISDIWDIKVHKGLYDEVFEECVTDFMAAVDERLMLSVLGEEYTIRNARSITEENLRGIFRFPSLGKQLIIDKRCIVDMSSEPKPTFEEKLAYGKENKAYFKKIVWLACHKRYDDLTDIEAAVYCFALHYAKHQETNIGKRYFLEWFDKWYDYFCMPSDDILSCLEDDVKYPQYYFSFAARKIRQMNHDRKQDSAVDGVDEKAADDYWYEVATKGKFK